MKSSIEDAKSKTLQLYSSLTHSIGKKEGLRFSIKAFKEADEVAQDVTALENSRLSLGNRPMDYYAPSFWHAAAYLLTVYIYQRISSKKYENVSDNFETLFGNIAIYRGQSNPWNIIPAAWRQSQSEYSLGNRKIEAFKTFVSSFMTSDDAIELDIIGQIDTLKKAEALAQHYELKTNLVDFTFNPITALYFASGEDKNYYIKIDGVQENCGVVYMTAFDKARATSNFHFSLPPIQAKRLLNQSGLFIDFGERPSDIPDILDFSQPWMHLQQNCMRFFFHRKFPKDDAIEVFNKDFVLEADPFLLETVKNINNLDFVKNDTLEKILTELKFCQTQWPSWRTKQNFQLSDVIYTDDEFIEIGKHIEKYLRASILLNLNGHNLLDPFILKILLDNDNKIFLTLEMLPKIYKCSQHDFSFINEMTRASLLCLDKYLKAGE